MSVDLDPVPDLKLWGSGKEEDVYRAHNLGQISACIGTAPLGSPEGPLLSEAEITHPASQAQGVGVDHSLSQKGLG